MQAALAFLYGGIFLALILLNGQVISNWAGTLSKCMYSTFCFAFAWGVGYVGLMSFVIVLMAPALMTFMPLVLVVVPLFSVKRILPMIKGIYMPFIMVLCYSMLAAFSLFLYSRGAGAGEGIFWTIYNMTGITPGDSPQGLIQAQFYLKGCGALTCGTFSIFDRPILPGLLTAVVLSVTNNVQSVGDLSGYDALLTVGCWIWLNSSFVIAALLLIHKHAESTLVTCMVAFLVLLSPFVLLNTIGLWPKLAACTLLVAAIANYLQGRTATGAWFGGLAFLMHGSFLWPHVALLGVMGLAKISQTSKKNNHNLWRVLISLSVGAVIPGLWFAMQHALGGESPLRYYYFYGVEPSYSLTHSSAQIIDGFYRSTSKNNLFLLPFVNVLKCLLPTELLSFITNFSYSNGPTSMLEAASRLFSLQFNRPFYAFGLVGGIMLSLGLLRKGLHGKREPFIWAVCLILPLIPDVILYRRDDILITPVMFYAIIPIVLTGANLIRSASKRVQIFLAAAMCCEYLLVYWYREPSATYLDASPLTFRNEILIIILAGFVGIAIWALFLEARNVSRVNVSE